MIKEGAFIQSNMIRIYIRNSPYAYLEAIPLSIGKWILRPDP